MCQTSGQWALPYSVRLWSFVHILPAKFLLYLRTHPWDTECISIINKTGNEKKFGNCYIDSFLVCLPKRACSVNNFVGSKSRGSLKQNYGHIPSLVLCSGIEQHCRFHNRHTVLVCHSLFKTGKTSSSSVRNRTSCSSRVVRFVPISEHSK